MSGTPAVTGDRPEDMDWSFVLQTIAALCLSHVIIEAIAYRALPLSVRHKSFQFAFEILAGFCVTYLSYHGLTGYYSTAEELEDKIYHSSVRAQHMAEFMVAYQVYDILVLVDPACGGAAMLVHHILTGSLALSGCYGYMHGYCFFFFGVIETSNIVLTVVDIFKMFPALEKRFHGAYVAVRGLFALVYVYFRLILWPIVCFDFLSNVHVSFTTGKVYLGTVFGSSQLEVFVALLFVFANMILTFLQLMWGFTIVKGALKQLGVIKSSSHKRKKVD